MNAYQDERSSALNTIPLNAHFTFGQQYFIEPSDYSKVVLPSVYSEEDTPTIFIRNGIVDYEALKIHKTGIIVNNDTFVPSIIMSGGRYIVQGDTHLLLPDEGISLIVSSDSFELPYKPSFKIKPILTAYKRTNINKIVKHWDYRPQSDLSDPTKNEWKFNISNGIYIVNISNNPVDLETYYSVLPTRTATINNISYKMYFLPNFPCIDIKLDQNYDEIIDELRGIIYIPESHNTNDLFIVGRPTAMFGYIPYYAKDPYVTIPYRNDKYSDNYFVVLTENANNLD